MSEMLRSIKADLTSRRMLPLLVLALGLFAGALAYVVLGGKPSVSPVATSPAPQTPTVSGPTVSSAPANPHATLAETTSGTSYQHGGKVHNPFTELPGSKSATTAAASEVATSEASPSSSGQSGSSESSSGESTTGVPGESPGPVEQSTVYEGSLTLTLASEPGATAPGAPAGPPQTFVELKSLQLLPSKQKALVAYAGAQSEGKGALFLLVTPAIVHGKARCLPSTAECESIFVQPKQSEELQYLQGGKVVTYTLAVKQIASKKVSASAAKTAAATLVVQERTQLEELGVSLPAKVHFSEEVEGVLTGIGNALTAAKKSEASSKQAAPGETGTSGSGE